METLGMVAPTTYNNTNKESPEEIARYIEERRKKWPSAKKIEQTNHKQWNALQLVAKVYEEKTTDSAEAPSSNQADRQEPKNFKKQKKPKSQSSALGDQVFLPSYRPNLYTLFVQKHVEKQQRILMDFIAFLYRENFLQNSALP
ncbi:hypothetical protein Gasu2_09160 [Galdieria sulphuraria]|nr:hypothetical protein Gasu2_09160 [Galdieria sulphuraria]